MEKNLVLRNILYREMLDSAKKYRIVYNFTG